MVVFLCYKCLKAEKNYSLTTPERQRQLWRVVVLQVAFCTRLSLLNLAPALKWYFTLKFTFFLNWEDHWGTTSVTPPIQLRAPGTRLGSWYTTEELKSQHCNQPIRNVHECTAPMTGKVHPKVPGSFCGGNAAQINMQQQKFKNWFPRLSKHNVSGKRAAQQTYVKL